MDTARSVAVIVPVLNRPHRVEPLHYSLLASTADERAAGWTVRLVFVCSPDDTAEIDAVRRVGLDPLIWPHPKRSSRQYARKVNHAADRADETWLLLAADDVWFGRGWLTAAIETHERTGAPVIGTNDLHNPSVKRGVHATHSLVRRDYIAQGTIDVPGVLLHDGYDHNCCDIEFVGTAKGRGAFAFAVGAVVEHVHERYGDAPDDATYRKGNRGWPADKELLASREPLWSPAAARRATARARAAVRRPTVAVLVSTFGDDRWRRLAEERAVPSTVGQDADEVLTAHEPGGNIATVRNELAARATSDWLVFLDADDQLARGYVRAIRRAGLRPGNLYVPAVSYNGARAAFPSGGGTRPLIDINWAVVATAVHRDLFFQVGGFRAEDVVYGDWSLWLRCVIAGARMRKVPRAVYLADAPAESLHRSDDPARKKAMLREYHRIRDEFRGGWSAVEQRRAAARVSPSVRLAEQRRP